MSAGENRREIHAGAIVVACVKIGGVIGAIVGGVACLEQGRTAVRARTLAPAAQRRLATHQAR